ncbi:MAG TPA: carbon-nitrogen hydrolase family protein [Opitutus sp.]|nr:carbon-nitrogen hydrolase family protein [Opitutus sp.]
MNTSRLVGCLLAGAVLAAAAEAASQNLIPALSRPAGGTAAPAGWTTWAPRPALMPKCEAVSADGDVALKLSVDRFEQNGRWETTIGGIAGGKFYRFEALSQVHKVGGAPLSTAALLLWCRNADGTGDLQCDYVDHFEPMNGWHRHYRTVQAPADAKSVKVLIGLRWSKAGAVLWKGMRLAEVPPPPARVIRIATTRIMPGMVRTVANNMQMAADMFDRIGAEKPDVVVFSETLPGRSTRLSLAEKAQTIPGPFTNILSERAKKYHSYAVASLHEKDGDLFYNTAVLIDREGRIVGKYRKVHLAMAESEAGLTPGNEFPVFQTDFGRVGLLICWDDWFAESARILRLEGAEIVFLPLAGDGSDAHWDVTSRARAMDNGLFFVSSGTVSDASRIITPNGDVLGEARGNFSYVINDVDLNEQWRLKYLSFDQATGEAKSLFIAERRPETYGALVRGPAPLPERRTDAGDPR